MSNDIDTFFSCELLFSDLLISDGIGGNFFAIYDFVKLIVADVLVVLLDILLSTLSVSLLLNFDHSFYMNSEWSVTKYLVVLLGKLIDFSCLWIIISEKFDQYLRCIFINNSKVLQWRTHWRVVSNIIFQNWMYNMLSQNMWAFFTWKYSPIHHHTYHDVNIMRKQFV